MHSEAGGFVKHREVVVFVEEVDGDVLGQYGARIGDGDVEFNLTADLNACSVLCDDGAIDARVALADEPLELVAPDIGQLLGKKQIQPPVSVGVGDDETMGFECVHGVVA